eukprot:53970_1
MSKKQNCSIYSYAILYLEKILTQTMYDKDYYNSMTNILYIPAVRSLAFRLIRHQLGVSEIEDIPLYVGRIFNRWCRQRSSISLETYTTESKFMSNEMKNFWVNPESNRVKLETLLALFPKLQRYSDINGKIIFVNDSTLNFKRLKIKNYYLSDSKDEKSWKCDNCGYNSFPLMVDSLWRYYNVLNECCLCGTVRNLKFGNDMNQTESKTNTESVEIDMKLQIIGSESEVIKHGFSGDIHCLIDVSDITSLSTEQLVDVIENHVIEEMKAGKQKELINVYKQQIMSYFTENNINGEIFSAANKKDLKNKIVKQCDNNRKLNGALNILFKATIKFDLSTISNTEVNDGDNTTFTQLLNNCPAMKRANFIVQYFESKTAELSKNGKYPHEM